MGKHVIPENELDNERTVWIRPETDPKADPGWRFRLDKMKGEIPFLFEEQVLPEHVDNPLARRVIHTKARSMLTRADATWLRDALDEMLKGEW